jgi:hypothetical protein
MSDLIEQIKADRDAGTPGNWRSYQDGVHPSFDGPSPQTTNGDFAVCQCFGPDMMANQSRIARVPQLEQIAIDAAAEIQRLTEENAKLREALTPSDDTEKAYDAYENGFETEGYVYNDLAIARRESMYVSWDAVQKIMAAIRVRAGIEGGE